MSTDHATLIDAVAAELTSKYYNDETTLRAYDVLTAAPTRSGVLRCPGCDDYVEDAAAPKRDHAATCAALRAELTTTEDTTR